MKIKILKRMLAAIVMTSTFIITSGVASALPPKKGFFQDNKKKS